MTNNKCEVGYCQFNKYENHNECVLHCDKKAYVECFQGKKNDYASNVLYPKFYEHLLNYTVNHIWKRRNNRRLPMIEKHIIRGYLDDHKIPDGNNVKEIKATFVKFWDIKFPPTYPNEESYYGNIFKKLGEIYFCTCSFWVNFAYNQLDNIDCSFYECHFYDSWSLSNCIRKGNSTLEEYIYIGCTFNEGVSFCNPSDITKKELSHSQFQDCTFEKDISFSNALIKKNIFCYEHPNVNKINKPLNIKFDNCILEDKFILIKQADDKDDDFLKLEQIDFKNTTFNAKVEMRDYNVNDLNIDNCNFKKIATFHNITFDKFNIQKSIFEGYVGFEECKFGKKDVAKFEYTTFLSFANFRNTHFQGGLNLDTTNLKEPPNFLNTDINPTNTSKETFRIIKHSFDRLENYTESNKYFALEMGKHKEEIKENGSMQEKFIFWLNELASDYGQSYLKPIGWLLGTTLVYIGVLQIPELCRTFQENNQNYIMCLFDLLNNFENALNYFVKFMYPFNKLLPENREFITLIFTIIQSALIWHTIVALKRHTKR